MTITVLGSSTVIFVKLAYIGKFKKKCHSFVYLTDIYVLKY